MTPVILNLMCEKMLVYHRFSRRTSSVRWVTRLGKLRDSAAILAPSETSVRSRRAQMNLQIEGKTIGCARANFCHQRPVSSRKHHSLPQSNPFDNNNNCVTRVSRTEEGRKIARKKNVKFGRKPKLTDHQKHKARERLAAGESTREITKDFGVSHPTIFKAKYIMTVWTVFTVFNEFYLPFFASAFSRWHCQKNG